MKIAAAAYPIDWHNRWNDYVGKLRVWVRTAAEQGAQLLVFPAYGLLELASLAGEANARDPAHAVEAVSARIKDVDDLHASLAREFGVHISAGSGPLRREDGARVHRARLFAPDGRAGYQDKLIPSRAEREAWGVVPGGPVRVFETALGRVGILIGSDALFPLVARAMVEAGAELLLVPSASEDMRGHARQRAAALVRAIEGQCIVVLATTVGTADWMPSAARNTGAAAIFGPPDTGFPEDGVVATGKIDAAGWVHGEIGLEAVAQARTEGSAPMVNDWAGQAEAVVEIETVPLGAVAAG